MQRLLSFIRQNIASILIIIATIDIAVCGAWLGLSDWHLIYQTWRGRLLLIGCLVLLIAQIIQFNNNANFDTLKNNNESLFEQLAIYKKIDPHKIISHILMGIAREKLGLDHYDRISIYQFTPEGFVLRGRYSENRDYNHKGRTIYPLNQGCIGRAYQRGEFKRSRLPDPHAHRTTYYTTLESEYDIPETTSRNFVMKSRSIIGVRIESLDHSDSLGVLVIESIKPQGFNSDDIFQLIDNEKNTLSALLNGFKEELRIKRLPALEGAF
ncbi:hypothetical protein [Geothrix fuzhouensis]|uniref:hypothetical protein n=1 Tax=Geothrix fuzhouensis TaxID=2966451 RepID=UPI0021472027|nr:hypothetical protein [Geothrix fuzhouensis]